MRGVLDLRELASIMELHVPEPESCFCYLRAWLPWVSDFTSLRLSVLICKMEKIIKPSYGAAEEIHDYKHAWHRAWHMAIPDKC